MSNVDVKAEVLEMIEDMNATITFDISCKDRVKKYGGECTIYGCAVCGSTILEAIQTKVRSIDITSGMEQQDGVITLPKDHDGVPIWINDDVYELTTDDHYKVTTLRYGGTNPERNIGLENDKGFKFFDYSHRYIHKKPPRTCADIIADVMDADKPFSVEAAVNEAYEIGRRDGANDRS